MIAASLVTALCPYGAEGCPDNDGDFDIILPEPLGLTSCSGFKVRVIDVDDPEGKGADYSDSFYLMASAGGPNVGGTEGPYLVVTAPRRGDLAQAGEEYTVEFDYDNGVGSRVDRFSIDRYHSKGGGDCGTWVTNLCDKPTIGCKDSMGDYNILVPDHVPGGMYAVRVGCFEDDNLYGCSGEFEIVRSGLAGGFVTSRVSEEGGGEMDQYGLIDGAASSASGEGALSGSGDGQGGGKMGGEGSAYGAASSASGRGALGGSGEEEGGGDMDGDGSIDGSAFSTSGEGVLGSSSEAEESGEVDGDGSVDGMAASVSGEGALGGSGEREGGGMMDGDDSIGGEDFRGGNEDETAAGDDVRCSKCESGDGSDCSGDDSDSSIDDSGDDFDFELDHSFAFHFSYSLSLDYVTFREF